MTNFPAYVEFREEGPREGFQISKSIYPIEQRAELINLLSETGLQYIQVGSFVNPERVPQMADTADLFSKIARNPNVRYSALWLNENGFRQAMVTGLVDINPMLVLYTSDAFCRRNNNSTLDKELERQRAWLELYKRHGLMPELAAITTAFGCNFEGEISLEKVLNVIRQLKDLCAESNVPVPTISLADTMGWANPQAVKRMICAVRDLVPNVRLAMHLHDTRGLGIANLYAALEMGVDLFDSSVGGLGGCPFSGFADAGAAGNIATEDSVFLCHELGIETGVDMEKLVCAAIKAQDIIGSRLMSRILHSGDLSRFRS